MLQQGPSQNSNMMEWDKLFAINKGYLDPIAGRYNAMGIDSSAKVVIENGPKIPESKLVPLH